MKTMFKLGQHIKNLWKTITMDADELYLSKATDVVDLERRLRIISRGIIHKI